MKTLLTLLTLLSTQAFAQNTKLSYECAVKGLLTSSPEFLRLGDSVKIDLNLNNTPNVISKKISTATIGEKKIKGNVIYNKYGGAFPHSYVFVSNARNIMTLEVSKSGNNARIRSLSLSRASGGFPVIATLDCTKF